MSVNSQRTPAKVWLDSRDDELATLQALSGSITNPREVPHAIEIAHQIPVYDGRRIRQIAQAQPSEPAPARELQAEWARVLLHGAGAIVVRAGVDDLAMLDEVTAALQQIMDEESDGHSVADHFAASGANTRLWNAHEKLCVKSPSLFARYNANDTIEWVCKAWLGPAYQITMQVNVVHPGGRAQVCHRDYHMGFQDNDLLDQYPAHVHTFSPLLTLQGGIAHTDVPFETGPTQLLPFSQKLVSGYMSVKADTVREHFKQHYVQLALNKGDMMFFNPALMHAAGDNNTTDTHRFVNLMQVGSAYGRTLEIVDRASMSVALYPVLQSMKQAGSLNSRQIDQVVQACAEGYAFPASLDLEPPVGGLAPASQQAVMLQALEQGLAADDYAALVDTHRQLNRSR